ncbi:MAG: DUF1611 domain-containing protein [Xanthomonadales bacterium]|nr:DUF1611 domain-containing protein [Xanthomonadales bacterium]
MEPLTLQAPYLVLVGDTEDPTYAKTGYGIAHWRPDRVAGQLRFDNANVDLGVPDMTVAQAAEAGVRSLVIGVAPVGGSIPDSWLGTIVSAAEAGMDIVSGLHTRLGEIAQIRNAAAVSGANIIDIRIPPSGLPVATGRKRSGKRLLTVGTDCAVGKKYSALAIHAAMRDAAINATFRATGQTGIMISGSGMPIDAVVGDFTSGAAEILSPDNDPDHWDVIEGQGSLFHPGYAAVSLGLLHGSQPDAVVICHDATRTEIAGWPDYAPPSIPDCIERNVSLARLTNPAVRCAGVCVNTSSLQSEERDEYLATIAAETELPCVDPVIDGCSTIVASLFQV